MTLSQILLCPSVSLVFRVTVPAYSPLTLYALCIWPSEILPVDVFRRHVCPLAALRPLGSLTTNSQYPRPAHIAYFAPLREAVIPARVAAPVLRSQPRFGLKFTSGSPPWLIPEKDSSLAFVPESTDSRLHIPRGLCSLLRTSNHDQHPCSIRSGFHRFHGFHRFCSPVLGWCSL